MMKSRQYLPFIQVVSLRYLFPRSKGQGMKWHRWRIHNGGRGLLLWYVQGGLGLEWRILQFWGSQGGMRATSLFVGAAKMGYQSSLG
jgi:hypothetical protein